MKKIREKLFAIVIGGVTLVLAGVGIFTSIKLYSLRNQAVAPNAPQSTPAAGNIPLEVSPTSGNWNFTDSFTIKNNTSQSVTAIMVLDCWDESKCSDRSSTETLSPGQTITKGLGPVCSKWQLDIKIGTQQNNPSDWDWGAIVEVPGNCNATSSPTPLPNLCSLSFNLSTPTSTPTGTPTSTPTSTPTTTPTGTPTGTPTSTPTSTPTTTPTGTPTDTPTATPTSTPTNTPTGSPTTTPNSSTSTPVTSSTPRPSEMPAAGFSGYTWGIAAVGGLFIVLAMILAL